MVGPLTLASLNKGATATTGTGSVSMACPAGFTCTPVVTTTATCPAGYTCTAAPGTVTTGTTLTGITTPGVQGIMSVSSGPVSTSVAYAGNQKVPILDARIQAQYSDFRFRACRLTSVRTQQFTTTYTTRSI